MEAHIIETRGDPVLKKIRSTLKTEVVTTDAGGYSLGDEGIRKFELASLARKWPDIGKPTPFQIPFNHVGLDGQIFRLLRRGVIVAV